MLGKVGGCILLMESKLKVGVSSCLLGEKLRWNGEDKRDAVLLDELNKLFEYVSVCPEVEVGMGPPLVEQKVFPFTMIREMCYLKKWRVCMLKHS